MLSDEPPTEFRIFAAGVNTTTKGDDLFDAQAARDVMAAYEQHGVDVMIDLEHLSVKEDSLAFDPDARGWCKLALRGGELWAIDVKWTPDGEARLREKRQRYVSPLFMRDKKTGRVKELLNVAICGMPATDRMPALVAAAAGRSISYEGDKAMTPEQFAALAEALGLGADANVEDVLAQVAAMVKKIQDAANGTPPADETAAAAADAPKENEPAAMAAAKRLSVATRTLARLSGKPDLAASLAEVETWRKSHIELETQRASLAQDRATLEATERRKLVAGLVKCNAETPAFAWAQDADGLPDGKTPALEYAAMPIERLRAKVAARTTVPPKKPRPAGGDTDTDLGLSERELEKCKRNKVDPKKYAANKRAMTGEV